MSQTEAPSVSVLMPTDEQSRFIGRALDSLQAQTLTDWKAIMIDDGSRDATAQTVLSRFSDPRIRYYRFTENRGPGNALNDALANAKAPLVAYFPGDDVYFRDHLKSLKTFLETRKEAVLTYSGVRHHYNRQAAGQIAGFPLRLAQCMHRKTAIRWLQRQELEAITRIKPDIIYALLNWQAVPFAHEVLMAASSMNCRPQGRPTPYHETGIHFPNLIETAGSMNLSCTH